MLKLQTSAGSSQRNLESTWHNKQRELMREIRISFAQKCAIENICTKTLA